MRFIVFLLISVAGQGVAQSVFDNTMKCPDGRFFFRQGYAGHYGIVEPDGRVIIPARYAALSCFVDGIAWVAIEEERHWCPFGENGARLYSPECKTFYDPFPGFDSVQMPMSQDPFLSSLLWMQQWLRQAEDPSQPAPKWVSPDSYVIFGFPIYTQAFRPPASEEWTTAPNWP